MWHVEADVHIASASSHNDFRLNCRVNPFESLSDTEIKDRYRLKKESVEDLITISEGDLERQTKR